MKNLFSVFILIIFCFNMQAQSWDCNEDIHGIINDIDANCCDVLITSYPEDGQSGSIIDGNISALARVRIIKGEQSVRIVAPSDPSKSTIIKTVDDTIQGNYFVSNNGDDTNDGETASTAFLTIQKAMKEAAAGNKITILEGVYREYVLDQLGSNSGTANNYITYQSCDNSKVIIKGSEVFTGWTHTINGIYKLDSGLPINTQQVFYDGKMLRKIGFPSEDSFWPQVYEPIDCNENELVDQLCAGTFLFKKIDPNGTSGDLYVRLPNNEDPNNHFMEVSTEKRAWQTGDSKYIELKGLTFMHSNWTSSGQQGAMVAISAFTKIDGCTFAYADFSGLGLSGFNYVQGEDIGQIVKNSIFHHNGVVGLSSTAAGFLIENNTFHNNGFRPFLQWWGSAAIKITSKGWGEIRDNYIYDEHGNGIWFDFCRSGTEIRIHNNYLKNIGYIPNESLLTGGDYKNRGNGIFLEVTANAKVYNNIIDNAFHRGIYISTSWSNKVVNNLITQTNNRAQIGLSYEYRSHPTNPQIYTLHDNEIRNNILFDRGINCRNDIEYISNLNSSIPYDFNSKNILNYNLIYNSNNDYNYQHQGFLYTDDEDDYDSIYTSQGISWQRDTGNDTNSIEGDNPLFIGGTGTNSWKLQNNSPAINNGVNLDYISYDYIGNPRPQGLFFDIGPYEYELPFTSKQSNEIEDKFDTRLIFYPNPANNRINISNINPVNVNKIKVVDTNGKVVKEFKHLLNKYIDVSNIPSGLYLVNIEFKGGSSISQKIILK